MNQDRPHTTLFLVNSVDGRITSHDADALDPDKSWKLDPKIAARLRPFFDFASGDVHTLTHGRSMATIGINARTGKPIPLDVSLIVIDTDHLTLQGVDYLSRSLKQLYFYAPDSHPIHKQSHHPPNFHPIPYQTQDLKKLMHILHHQYDIQNVSIQSEANLNARWLSEGLVDELSVIISPLLVGRHGTPNLIDQDLLHVKPLELLDAKPFGASYVNLRYQVLND